MKLQIPSSRFYELDTDTRTHIVLVETEIASGNKVHHRTAFRKPRRSAPRLSLGPNFLHRLRQTVDCEVRKHSTSYNGAGFVYGPRTRFFQRKRGLSCLFWGGA